ncbi:ABC transporter ATP-binding protein [Priestia megaterium]|uniref:ABC transporter ATP-binding protein n=1 Tax=Priestia megaterium TaxID=1404 RepID=UPI002E1FEEB8|nr:ABC transporter ATP-binding protein [Priestia megaterium]
MLKGNYLLETKNLTKTYKGVNVVENLNLKIKEGEIYGFLGPNGAGKTTTIRMLLGLITPSEGDIQIFGKDFKDNRLDILSAVGSLVESPSYYPHLSGENNLETIRKILNVPKQKIHEVLDLVRLTKVADRKVSEYSLGMKQRLAIAASLLGNPRLIILDEPTNGLDPAGIIEIRDLIIKLPKEYGITVIISSHLLSEIEQVASQVGIITKGNMIFQDSIKVLREKALRRILFNTSDFNKTSKILINEGIEISEDPQGILIDAQTNKKIASLVRKMVNSDIDVYRIVEEKTSLEDIFLELTKGGETL